MQERRKGLGFTGHRVQRLGRTYDAATENALIKLAEAVISKRSPEVVISGMALGWDQAVAKASIHLRVPLLAAVPFPGQEARWKKREIEDYEDLLLKADHVFYVSEEGYSVEKLFLRNEFIVLHSSEIIALWDGEKRGGTWGAIQMAKEHSVPVANVWPSWEKYWLNERMKSLRGAGSDFQ